MLADELDMLSKEWSISKTKSGSFRMPYNITFCAKEIDVKVWRLSDLLTGLEWV